MEFFDEIVLVCDRGYLKTLKTLMLSWMMMEKNPANLAKQSRKRRKNQKKPRNVKDWLKHYFMYKCFEQIAQVSINAL